MTEIEIFDKNGDLLPVELIDMAHMPEMPAADEEDVAKIQDHLHLINGGLAGLDKETCIAVNDAILELIHASYRAGILEVEDDFDSHKRYPSHPSSLPGRTIGTNESNRSYF